MQRVDLNDLAAFAVVARRRNFRAAARELQMAASSLSQKIRDLEAAVGVPLLLRTTRSVAPTEAGLRLLERLTPALTDISTALDQLQESEAEPAGTLRINAPSPAVDLVLAELVSRFLVAYPRISIEITTEARLVDVVGEGYDAGVRWSEDLAQDMVAVRLGGPQRYVLVAAPSLIERVGRPEVPADLVGRPCLRQLFGEGRQLRWAFEREGRTVQFDPQGPLATTSLGLHLAAARAGLGFYMTFEDYVREDIARGRLVTLLDDWCPPFTGPFLYYPRHRLLRAPLKAFVGFLRHAHRDGPHFHSSIHADR